MLIIPAIDLKSGKCVRLKQGIMQQSTVFSDKPQEMVKRWVNAGARRLHLIDLDGAFAGKPINAEIIMQISENFPNLTIQIGGGIRSLEVAQSYIDSGIDYIIIGTMAVTNPEFVSELSAKFPQKIIIALDANNGLIATNGWTRQTNLSIIDLVEKFKTYSLNSIIYTDIKRDGMRSGINLETTAAIAKTSPIPIIASGGIYNLADITNLIQATNCNLLGAISGRAIYEDTLNFSKAQKTADNLCT